MTLLRNATVLREDCLALNPVPVRVSSVTISGRHLLLSMTVTVMIQINASFQDEQIVNIFNILCRMFTLLVYLQYCN